MVKSYDKYEQSHVFGAIAAGSSNAVWAADTTAQRQTGAGKVFVGANEQVLCWDVKKSELVSTWQDRDCFAEVTAIARSSADPDVFAVGYSDGSIRLWDSKLHTVLIKFDGHRAGITLLAFDAQGTRLASGSKDTDIIIWDLITEVGLFKLRGHKGQITGLHFISVPSGADGASQDLYLLSTSKDALIKLWDIASQYSIETHVTQANGECWALAVSPDSSGCITAGNDGQLAVWTLDTSVLAKADIVGTSAGKVLVQHGLLTRKSGDRTTGAQFHPRANFVALHGTDKAVEIWRIRTPAEIQKSMSRKRKRRREKAAESGEQIEGDDGPAPISEVFVPHVIVRTGGKVRSFDWASHEASKTVKIVVSCTNNQLEMYSVGAHDKKQDEVEYTRTLALDLPGHRADIRALALSSDDGMLATAASGSLKIWNVKTQSCLRTLECGYALCCAFLPGDKIVIVGNKAGQLELFDITSASLIDTVDAHDGAVWTMAVHPDGRSLATGSADKTVKFWSFEIVQEDIPGTKRTTSRLKLVQQRMLKLGDDILNLVYSPDARLLAVATLDNTVKVFFDDSLKLFLNLYGHKLPVLNMSISADSKMIATSSADKNVRLWGLDFGDCHKAIFAHDESIMQVSFIPQAASREDMHLFFSASKDGLVKQWDGDKFEHIQKLRGHHGEIWAMTVARKGDFVVTASHDKSIRVWSRTAEPLFLEEEREREQEDMFDQNLAANLEKDQADEYAAADEAGNSAEVIPASKQTAATLTAGEKIAEALELCLEDLDTVTQHERQIARNPTGKHAPPERHPLLALRNVSAEAHLLSVFEGVGSAALNDALLLTSFSQLPGLFTFFAIWLEKEMNVMLACHVFFFVLKLHHKQIVASTELRGQLEVLQASMRRVLDKTKHVMGYNLAAARMLEARVADLRVKTLEDEQAVEAGQGTNARKRAFANIA